MECVLCYETNSKGEQCPSEHFICSDCFHRDLSYYRHQVVDADGRVKCRICFRHLVGVKVEKPELPVIASKTAADNWVSYIENDILCRRCPRCNVVYDWEDGCNHLKCKICSLRFCGLCLKEKKACIYHCVYRRYMYHPGGYSYLERMDIAYRLSWQLNFYIPMWERADVVRRIRPVLPRRIHIGDAKFFYFYKVYAV